MDYLERSERLPVRRGYDVVVAGGGVAGAAAALSAVRNGKTALLLERSFMLGGLATAGLINFFVPMCNGRGTQIVFGMAEEMLRLSIAYGYDTLPHEWLNGQPTEKTDRRYVTTYSAQIFALVLASLLQDEGVDILMDCYASEPVMDGTRCRGLVVQSKSGREFIPAEMVIDTTGDADILFRAGVPTIQGRNFFTYIAHAITLDSCRKAADTANIASAFARRCGGVASLYGGNQPPDVPLYRGTDLDDINDYLRRNQRLLLDRLRREPRRSRDVITLPTMPQFRTTRRLDGDYTLKETDCYKHFDDSVAAINDFDRRDFLYEVPLRTLTRRGFGNLLTAGRSASGEGYGWDLLRVIPPAILTGQVTGLVAAMALDDGCDVADVNIRELQRRLELANVPIHFDDALIPADRTVEHDDTYVHI